MCLLKKIFFILCNVFIFFFPFNTHGEDASNLKKINSNEIYAAHRISFQVVSGTLFSLTNLPPDSPDFDYFQTNLRLGWIVNNPRPFRFFPRGNLEAIFELSNSTVHKGFGNYIGGITGLLRYNIVNPDWTIVPYIQAGAGIVYTDAYKDHSQKAIGQAVEFTPQLSLGLHFLISKNWSADVEAMFHHISNAGLADNNRGINAVGGFVGLTYFSGWNWK